MMKTAILPVIASMLLALSCEHDELSSITKEVTIDPVPSIESNTTAPIPAKGVISGTSFPRYSSYSIWICKAGGYSAFNAHSTNIKAYLTSSDIWNYGYDGHSAIAPSIIVKQNGDNSKMDVYAYAPYFEATDIENIGFKASDQYDLMYAVENATDANKGIDITSASTVSTKFRFHHALSLIEILMKKKNTGHVSFNNVYLQSTGGTSGTQIYSEGSFNATTGVVTGTKPGISKARYDGLSISVSDSEYRSVLFTIIPSDCMGDDLKMVFTINDVTYSSIPICRNDLRHGDSEVYGFQPGYKYTFTVEIDNYIHLQGVTVSDDWTELTMPEKQI